LCDVRRRLEGDPGGRRGSGLSAATARHPARHTHRHRVVITVHHLSSSRSERIVWLLEELGTPYRMEWFQREPTGAAPPEMKALHALGRSPVIHDGEQCLAESGAIVEHIVRRHGKGAL